MIRPPSFAGRAAGVLVALLLLAAAAVAGGHRDEKAGFSVRVPKKWRSLPIPGDELWIVAKFQSDREYWPKRDFGMPNRPELRVVLLPLEPGRTISVRTARGDRVEVKKPYKSFRAYLEDNAKKEFETGGWHFSAERETEIRGTKVIQYEISFTKLTDSPRRIFAWAYYAEDCIFGVMGDCLIEWEKKLEPEIFASLKSFRLIARSGPLPWGRAADAGDPPAKGSRKPDGPAAEEELSDEEIEKRRRDLTARELARIEASLAKGWRITRSKHFVAVTHADPRYTRSLLQHAETLRKWLEDTLGFVGSGYTGTIIIRICADERESEGYESSIPWSHAGRIEVVTYKDKEGWSDWAMESLNRGVFHIWIREKNPELLVYAPGWLERGLDAFVEDARTKRGRVEFGGDTWDRVRMMELRRAGKLIAARDFFRLTQAAFGKRESGWIQARAFVQFLLGESVARSAKYRAILPDYLKNLIFLADEASGKDDALKKLLEKEPQTEKEELDLMKERKDAWARAEAGRIQILLDRTFRGWSEADWSKLDATYLREVK